MPSIVSISPPQTLPYRCALPDNTIHGVTLVDPETQRHLCHKISSLPFAVPPTGSSRFRAPQPLPAHYRYHHTTTDVAGFCPQTMMNGPGDPKTWDEARCLSLHMWIPIEDPVNSTTVKPPEGWPVLVFLHGGFLQWGHPGVIDPRNLLGDPHGLRAIIVSPGYRLGVLGFLAEPELRDVSPESDSDSGDTVVPNVGFWDQRCALEWCWDWIGKFGGNREEITLSGYSAGAHSTFHQLAHDLFPPQSSPISSQQQPRRIIKRAILHSNGPGPSPRPLESVRPQFDALCGALRIPSSWSAFHKISALRDISAELLVKASYGIAQHEFRAVDDNDARNSDSQGFIPRRLYAMLDSGEFARELHARGIELLVGECAAEHHLYAKYRAPLQSSALGGLQRRLEADYPADVVEALLSRHYAPDGDLPRLSTVHYGHSITRSSSERCPSWNHAFGAIYSDLQIHALQRGLLSCLSRHDAGDPSTVRRYRIAWRSRVWEKSVPLALGADHTLDMAIWFLGNGMRGGSGLEEDERVIARTFCAPVWRWIEGARWKEVDASLHSKLGPIGRDAAWHAADILDVRLLDEEGRVQLWRDRDWERGKSVWDLIRETEMARSWHSEALGPGTKKIRARL